MTPFFSHLFTHPITLTLILNRSLTHLFTLFLLTHFWPLSHSLTHSLPLTRSHTFSFSLTGSPTHSLILSYSLTHFLFHSFAHPLNLSHFLLILYFLPTPSFFSHLLTRFFFIIRSLTFSFHSHAYPFIQIFTHFLTHSLTSSFSLYCSPTHSFTFFSLTHYLAHSLTFSLFLTHLLTHPFTLFVTHSLTGSLTFSLFVTHLLTRSFTLFLTYSLSY